MAKISSIAVALVFIYMTDVNLSADAVRALNTTEIVSGNLTTQLLKLTIYLLAVGMLLTRWKDALKMSVRNFAMWVVLAWALASMLWSVEPSVTLRTAAGLLGTALIGLYIACFHDRADTLRIAGWAFLLLCVASIIAILVLPSRGGSFDAPGWRGVFASKNALGQISLVAMIMFLCLFAGRDDHGPWLVGLLLAGMLLVGSRSGTALVAGAFAVVVWGILFSWTKRAGPVFIVLSVGFLVMVDLGLWLYLSNNVGAVLGVVGKDPTLTSRTFIWDAVTSLVRQRPWVGYGYGAAWIGTTYGPGATIANAIEFYPGTAHNGYLDLILQIGITGAILVCALYLGTVRKWLFALRADDRESPYQIWAVVFIVALLIYNLAEAYMLQENSVAWILVSALSFWTPDTTRAQVAERAPQLRPGVLSKVDVP